MLQQMPEMPPMGINTRIITVVEVGSDMSQHPRCCTNIICCILHAERTLLSGVNTAGVIHIFHETLQVKVYWIKVWQLWWSQHMSLWDNAYLTTTCSLTKICWGSIMQKSHLLLCMQQNILKQLR
jgi:hypothetical protein